MHSVIKKIQSFFTNRPKAFVIDDDVESMSEGISVIKEMDLDVEGYTDCNNLLYKLRIDSGKYKFGVIHENGSKYKPQALINFIKNINPNIILIIYKDVEQLRQAISNIQNLVLT